MALQPQPHPHPLYGASLRHVRADMHLSEARRLVAGFSEACKDHIVTDDDGRIVKLDGWPEIPNILPVVVSDAIHNMRAALDYIVFELARYDSGRIQDGTQFIIEDVKVDATNPKRGFDARSKQYLRGLNHTHIDMIEGLQPYNDVGWTKALRDISNPDKHRALTPLGSIGRTVSVVFRPLERGRFGPTRMHAPDGSGNMIMTRYDVDLDATHAIAISAPEPDAPSLMDTLQEIEAEVGRAIVLFEPEFR